MKIVYKISKELDEKAKKKFGTWHNFLDNLKEFGNPSSSFLSKLMDRVYGYYPPEKLPKESVLKNWMFDFEYINSHQYKIIIEQYEREHPFIYYLDLFKMILIAELIVEPFSEKGLFETNLCILDDKFIKKCNEKK